MFLFGKGVNVAIALADNLASSILCSEGLRYFLKGRAPSRLEETALGGRDSVSSPLKATVILLSKDFQLLPGWVLHGFFCWDQPLTAYLFWGKLVVDIHEL